MKRVSIFAFYLDFCPRICYDRILRWGFDIGGQVVLAADTYVCLRAFF